MSEPTDQYPDPTEVADETDEQDWDAERDGRMADLATPDTHMPTTCWRGPED